MKHAASAARLAELTLELMEAFTPSCVKYLWPDDEDGFAKLRDSLSKISASKTKDATAKTALVSVSAQKCFSNSPAHIKLCARERSLLLHSRKKLSIRGRGTGNMRTSRPKSPPNTLFYFLGARRSPPTQYPPSPTMFPPRPCASFRPENIASRPIRIAPQAWRSACGPSPRLTPSDTRATSTCAAASPPTLQNSHSAHAPPCHRRFRTSRSGPFPLHRPKRRRSSAADGRSTSPSEMKVRDARATCLHAFAVIPCHQSPTPLMAPFMSTSKSGLGDLVCFSVRKAHAPRPPRLCAACPRPEA